MNVKNTTVYNPSILMYDEQTGPTTIPLQDAVEMYGCLPSAYELITSEKRSGENEIVKRSDKKVLNLDLGINVKRVFDDHPLLNLKGFIDDFYRNWHRNYPAEYGLSTEPLFNLNEAAVVKRVLSANETMMMETMRMNAREYIQASGCMRAEILNSISDEMLLDKATARLEKNLKANPRDDAFETLSKLKIKQELQKLCALFGRPCDSISAFPVEAYADEIAAALGEMAKYTPVRHVDALQFRKGRGVEFDFAPRDVTYLKLGRRFGDCTSDQKRLQTDTRVENIYWTVFAWIFDANYQILRVFDDGTPVIKCHLLPLLLRTGPDEPDSHFFLSVDAIETTSIDRKIYLDDQEVDPEADRKFESVFEKTLGLILSIADRIGVKAVYSERFSNSKWIRNRLGAFGEIYLDTHDILKIDELEDVYECVKSFCAGYGVASPASIFMELQARNTYLMPEFIIGANKSFSTIRSGGYGGLPLKKVYGI